MPGSGGGASARSRGPAPSGAGAGERAARTTRASSGGSWRMPPSRRSRRASTRSKSRWVHCARRSSWRSCHKGGRQPRLLDQFPTVKVSDHGVTAAPSKAVTPSTISTFTVRNGSSGCVEADLDGAVGGVVGGLERRADGIGRVRRRNWRARGPRASPRQPLRELDADRRRRAHVGLAVGGRVEDHVGRRGRRRRHRRAFVAVRLRPIGRPGQRDARGLDAHQTAVVQERPGDLAASGCCRCARSTSKSKPEPRGRMPVTHTAAFAAADDEVVAALARRVGQVAKQVAPAEVAGDRDRLARELPRLERQRRAASA